MARIKSRRNYSLAALASVIVSLSAVPGNAAITPFSSAWQPAMAGSGFGLILAWVGASTAQGFNMYTSMSTDGVNWTAPQVVSQTAVKADGCGGAVNNPARSSPGPGLAVAPDGTTIWLAWEQYNGASCRTLSYTQSAAVTFGNIAWGGTYTPVPGQQSAGNPAVVASATNAYVAWNGTNRGQNINLACLSGAGCPGFSQQQTLSTTSCCGVGLVYDPVTGKIMLLSNSSGGQVEVQLLAGSPLVPFGSPTFFSSVSTGPSGAPAPTGGSIYVGWPGLGKTPGSIESTWLAQLRENVSSTTVIAGPSQTPAGQTTKTNPALATFGGHVYYAWLGTDNRINVTPVL